MKSSRIERIKSKIDARQPPSCVPRCSREKLRRVRQKSHDVSHDVIRRSEGGIVHPPADCECSLFHGTIITRRLQ